MSGTRNLLKQSLYDFLSDMNDPRKEALIRLYQDYEELLHYAAGSSHNHQAWDGGYADHIAETLRINEAYYEALNAIRPLEFSKESALIALFFHDIEKPFRYGPEDHEECNKWRALVGDGGYEAWEDIKWDIMADLEERYGFKITDEERHAIEFAHGEGSAHKKFERATSPLAAHVHHCDNTSARIWHDDGKNLSRHQRQFKKR